ncbi:unnamed protein product (macronuclear) [Paramecium tetraurelia]|uniref:Uncharacterized protein n=1 Tax=Paramecium tetraurelia TaxID=5888 RepID=A0D2G3_PARTE|nr:uncharacterized protein GSPATT00012738001 [Paramecium tetraurelia]CAK77230.1 unnamed protein product [Paramecium tetraurelia]|eukprot:XP_001444627.1 hypothetical protein (macronuclear) [Paramecium tetraurelia strain d4-2]
MKNGILLKDQLSLSKMKKLLLQLDELQEQYLDTMEQTQIQLSNINSNSDCKINITQIYSSNKPFELLETLQTYLMEIKNAKNPIYMKLNQKLKQLIFSLNKAKSVQQQIKQQLEILSTLMNKLKYKKECQILITTFSLILKKRQKFQLKLLQKNNQLSDNLNNLSELLLNQETNKDNIKQYFELQTLQDILDKKVALNSPAKTVDMKSESQTNKIKEEDKNFELNVDNQKHLQMYYNQPQMYYNYFNYSMYQQYCYLNQLKQAECNILNSQLLYQHQPYFFNCFLQMQQNPQSQT